MLKILKINYLVEVRVRISFTEMEVSEIFAINHYR